MGPVQKIHRRKAEAEAEALFVVRCSLFGKMVDG